VLELEVLVSALSALVWDCCSQLDLEELSFNNSGSYNRRGSVLHIPENLGYMLPFPGELAGEWDETG
jgi:hypothetical protein